MSCKKPFSIGKIMTIKLEDSAFIVIDLQTKLLPLIADSQNVIDNCFWLSKVAQRLNLPTLICEQYPKGLAHTYQPIRDLVPASAITAKTSFSAGRDTIFTDKLASLNKKQVILCGIEAHVCVLQTAMDLAEVDYEVYVVVDAIGSRNPNDKKFAIKRMIQHGIFVVTKEMVLFECLEQADTPLFKAMSSEFLK